MENFKKKIVLYNLLHNRNCVTLKTIMNLCGVSERTAYRYINQLSEARVPLFYNKKLGGYCIDKELQNNCSFDLDNSILIVVALKNLSRFVNNPYKDKINELLKSFIIKQKYPLEEVIQTYSKYLDNLDQLDDFSKLITSLLIFSAIRFKKKMNVTFKENNKEKNEIINEPEIIFNDKWKILDFEKINENIIIDDILMISFENK